MATKRRQKESGGRRSIPSAPQFTVESVVTQREVRRAELAQAAERRRELAALRQAARKEDRAEARERKRALSSLRRVGPAILTRKRSAARRGSDVRGTELEPIELAASGPPQYQLLQLPFSLAQSSTDIVSGRRPRIIESFADPALGRLEFKLASQHGANEHTNATASAAIGFPFRAAVHGHLSISTVVHFNPSANCECKYASAMAWGWIGLRVQAYSITGELLSTPIRQQEPVFRRACRGGETQPFPARTADVDWIPAEERLEYRALRGSYLRVLPSRKYAIFIECGGQIRAKEWRTVLGTNYGSDAHANLKCFVPWVVLRFIPVANPLPRS